VDACHFSRKCGGTTDLPISFQSPTGFYCSMTSTGPLVPVFTRSSHGDVRLHRQRTWRRTGVWDALRQYRRTSSREIASRTLTLVSSDPHVTERVSVQYRLNLFNALNHPNFGIPNSIRLDQAGTTFNNYLENSGGRRSLEMAYASCSSRLDGNSIIEGRASQALLFPSGSAGRRFGDLCNQLIAWI